MKNTITLFAVLIAGIAIGLIINLWSSNSGEIVTSRPGQTERTVLYWKAPMDPNYRSDKPGKSPMGMDLVPIYAGSGGDDESVVSIDPQVVNNLGVRTAAARQSVLSRRVETVGYVGYDENTLQHIHMRVDGWIESLAITATGDPVRKGQTLFELYSPKLVNAEQEYLTALGSGNAMLQKASYERLQALGVPTSEIKRLDKSRKVKQRLSVLAEDDGFVANLMVREGVYITPASEVMSISTLDRVWVLAEVFERQAAWIQPGQRAEVELEYLPGKRLQGSVDYIYPELDVKSRTLTVRMRFDNKAEILRPNMFARVTIHGTETPAVVHVPLAALIRGGTVDRVVLALGGGKFRAQAVEVGIESGDRIEIRSGVAAGDLVVTSGQFLIDSESNIESAMARMDDRSAAVLQTAEPTMGGMDKGTPDGAVTGVTVAAIVSGIDAIGQKLTLQHDAVPEWSWPAMTMAFEVANAHLLMGLNEGQSVEVTIEKQPGNHYVVTAISPAEVTEYTEHDMPQGDAPMEHDGHNMEQSQ